jgi:hypothetical protein
MVIRTEIFNLDSNGSKNYLSAGQTQLPLLFYLFFFIYLFFLSFGFTFVTSINVQFTVFIC